jgi:abhydrolase domain-containing protein 14
MSGNYSLPFIAKHSDRLGGFVAVAPVGVPQMLQQLQGIALPTLAIWGSDDRIIPLEQAQLLEQFMSNVQTVILEQAGHACYMKAGILFKHDSPNRQSPVSDRGTHR